MKREIKGQAIELRVQARVTDHRGIRQFIEWVNTEVGGALKWRQKQAWRKNAVLKGRTKQIQMNQSMEQQLEKACFPFNSGQKGERVSGLDRC